VKRLEAKSMVLLRHHLKALRLPTIGIECEKVAAQASTDNVDHLSYLLQLCELELLERERKAAERRMKAAKFPTTKSLATFDFLARPSVNKMLVLELARCSFIDERENVLFIGNPGTGKSHLATAIAAEACAKGYKVRFFRVTELVTMLIEAKDQRVLARLKTQLSKLDLLVLDELGYVPATKVGAELLFDVIATAYERSSIMVTTNLPFEKAHRFERTCARWRLNLTGSRVPVRETPLVDVIGQVVDESFGSHSQCLADDFRIEGDDEIDEARRAQARR
jgi:DNA replication protein DnaC